MTRFELLSIFGAFFGPITGVLTAFYLVKAEKNKEKRKEKKRISLVRNSLISGIENLSESIFRQEKAITKFIEDIKTDDSKIYRFPVIQSIKPIRFREFKQTDIYDILTDLESEVTENRKDVYNKFMDSIETTEFTFNQLLNFRNETISKYREIVKRISELNNQYFRLFSNQDPKLHKKEIAIEIYKSGLTKKITGDENDIDFFHNRFVEPFISKRNELLKSDFGAKIYFMATDGKQLTDDVDYLVKNTILLVNHNLNDLKQTQQILKETNEILKSTNR